MNPKPTYHQTPDIFYKDSVFNRIGNSKTNGVTTQRETLQGSTNREGQFPIKITAGGQRAVMNYTGISIK